MGGPLGDWCTRESGLGLSNFFFFFSFLFFFSFFFFVPFHVLFFPFPFPFPFFLRCGFLLQIPHIQQTSLYTKSIKSPEYCDFNLSWSGLQLLQNLKPIRLFSARIPFVYIYLYLNYTILLLTDLKNQKVPM